MKFHLVSCFFFFILCYNSCAAQTRVAVDSTTHLYGLKNAAGKWLTKPAFAEIEPVYPSKPFLFITKDKGFYGLCDLEGREILKPEFDRFEFRGDSLIVAKKNKLYGLYDLKGKPLLLPRYDAILEFYGIPSVGKCVAVFQDNKIILLDLKGNPVLPGIKQSMFHIRETDLFLVVDRVSQWWPYHQDGQKMGVVNLKEEVIIPSEYDKIQIFKEGFQVTKAGKTGLFDISGKVIFEPRYIIRHHQSYAFLGNHPILIIQTDDNNGTNLYGFMRNTGEVLIEPVYERLDEILLEGKKCYQAVYQNKWCLLDSVGNIILEPVYDEFKHYYFQDSVQQHRLFITKMNGKFGILGPDAKKISPLEFDTLFYLHDKKDNWSPVFTLNDKLYEVSYEKSVWNIKQVIPVKKMGDLLLYSHKDVIFPVFKDPADGKLIFPDPGFSSRHFPIKSGIMIMHLYPEEDVRLQNYYFDREGFFLHKTTKAPRYHARRLYFFEDGSVHSLHVNTGKFRKNFRKSYSDFDFKDSDLNRVWAKIPAPGSSWKDTSFCWVALDTNFRKKSSKHFDTPFYSGEHFALMNKGYYLMDNNLKLLSPVKFKSHEYGRDFFIVTTSAGKVGGIDLKGNFILDTLYTSFVFVKQNFRDPEWVLLESKDSSLLFSHEGPKIIHSFDNSTTANALLMDRKLMELIFNANYKHAFYSSKLIIGFGSFFLLNDKEDLYPIQSLLYKQFREISDTCKKIEVTLGFLGGKFANVIYHTTSVNHLERFFSKNFILKGDSLVEVTPETLFHSKQNLLNSVRFALKTDQLKKAEKARKINPDEPVEQEPPQVTDVNFTGCTLQHYGIYVFYSTPENKENVITLTPENYGDHWIFDYLK